MKTIFMGTPDFAAVIHFNRYYLSPLLERGIIVRTDPDHPQSPQQRYRLA